MVCGYDGPDSANKSDIAGGVPGFALIGIHLEKASPKDERSILTWPPLLARNRNQRIHSLQSNPPNQ
jgi:hypothetical protein